MTWFWLALTFALWTSIGISIAKKLTARMELLFLILMQEIVLLPFMFLLILFSGGIPILLSKFYPLVLAAGVLDFLAALLSMYAIKVSPISLISPISSFNPVFTTLIAFLALHESLTPTKLLGIFIIVVGSYILNISELKEGILSPLKRFLANKGVLAFLAANFIWAITPIFQKQAIFQTKPVVPLFTSFFEGMLVALFFVPLVLTKTKNQIPQIQRNWKLLLILGPFGAIAQWAAFTAFSLANLGIVTAVFKLSTLFTVILGGIFFKEEKIKERFLGAAIMIIGTLLLIY